MPGAILNILGWKSEEKAVVIHHTMLCRASRQHLKEVKTVDTSHPNCSNEPSNNVFSMSEISYQKLQIFMSSNQLLQSSVAYMLKLPELVKKR